MFPVPCAVDDRDQTCRSAVERIPHYRRFKQHGGTPAACVLTASRKAIYQVAPAGPGTPTSHRRPPQARTSPMCQADSDLW